MEAGLDGGWLGWGLAWMEAGLDGGWLGWRLAWMEAGLDGGWLGWGLEVAATVCRALAGSPRSSAGAIPYEGRPRGPWLGRL
jgi:hypothetical protein